MHGMARRNDPLSLYLRDKYPRGLPKTGRTHGEVCEDFIRWFKATRQMTTPSQAWRLLDNNSGMAHHRDGTVIPYGMPSVGGGPDKFAFGPGGVAEFYEVKTFVYPTLSVKQIRVADWMTALGFSYFVVMEDPEDGRGFSLVEYLR